MLSDIAGDVKRCVDARESYLAGRSTKDYSAFYLERVREACEKELPARVLPEFMDEIRSLEEYLNGSFDADYILRYWKQYEYANLTA